MDMTRPPGESFREVSASVRDSTFRGLKFVNDGVKREFFFFFGRALHASGSRSVVQVLLLFFSEGSECIIGPPAIKNTQNKKRES